MQRRPQAYLKLVGSRWEAYKPSNKLSSRHDPELVAWYHSKRATLGAYATDKPNIDQRMAAAVCRLYGWSY